MAPTDESFDVRIHDAYERVELGAEAQERMLGRLLAAQAAQRTTAAPTGAAEPQEQATAQAPTVAPAGEVVAFAPKRRRWLAWLSAAAALTGVLVVVFALRTSADKVEGAATFNTAIEAKSTADRDDEATAEEEAYEAVSADAAMADPAAEGPLETEGVAQEMATEPVAEGASEESDAVASSDAGALDSAPMAPTGVAPGAAPMDGDVLLTAELYPSITLEDGASFTTRADGLRPEEVAAGDVGAKVGAGSARPDAGGQASDDEGDVACEVFELVGAAGSYAVRYGGESGYWRCVPL